MAGDASSMVVVLLLITPDTHPNRSLPLVEVVTQAAVQPCSLHCNNTLDVMSWLLWSHLREVGEGNKVP